MKNLQDEFRNMFRALTAPRQEEILKLLSDLLEKQEQLPADPTEKCRKDH